jgi:hypothetical protein
MNKRAFLMAVMVSAGLVGTTQVALAQLPNVPVPVPTPSLPVPVPTVDVPDVPLPQLPAPPPPPPSVQLPSVPPPPPVPSVPLPSAPAPSGGGGSAPAVSGGGGSGTRSSGGGGAVQRSGSSGGGTSSGGGGGASGGSGGGGTAGRDGGGGGASRGGGGDGARGRGAEETPDRPARARALARERKLLRTIQRLRPCLPELPRLLTRVLVLRAGVGEADRLSRAQVARRLDRPLQVVRRYERRGVKRLRAAARAGECAPAAGVVEPDGSGVPGGVSTADLDLGEGTTVPTGTDGESGTDAAPGGGTAGGGANGDDGDRGGVKGESRGGGAIAGVVPRPPAPSDLSLPLMLLLIAGLAFAGVRAFRRFQDGAGRATGE